MKALIVENLLETIDHFFDGKEGHRKDPEFLKLCDRIAGKIVSLKFIGDDAFEAIDNNYWLPSCCFVVTANAQAQPRFCRSEAKVETSAGATGWAS